MPIVTDLGALEEGSADMSADTRAISRIHELSERVGILEPDETEPWRKALQHELEDVEHTVVGSRSADRSWPLIHALEERVNAHDTDLVYLSEQIDHHLSNEVSPSARKTARDEFNKLQKEAEGESPTEQERKAALERARTIIRDSHGRSRVKYDTALKTRFGLIVTSAALLTLAAVAVFAQSRSQEPFVPLPTNSTVSPTWFLLLLFGAGAVGGMLSAVFSLYLTKEVEDTSWFDPRPALACTKVAVGVWASVIAAVAVGTGALVGNFASLPAALLVGIAFGYAQQALTGILDKHATGLREGTKSASS